MFLTFSVAQNYIYAHFADPVKGIQLVCNVWLFGAFVILEIQGGQKKPDCFCEWITFYKVEIEMWIICHLVKKLVENMQIIVILHTDYQCG